MMHAEEIQITAVSGYELKQDEFLKRQVKNKEFVFKHQFKIIVLF